MKHVSFINESLTDSPNSRLGMSKTSISFTLSLCVVLVVVFSLTMGVWPATPVAQSAQQSRLEPVMLFEPNQGQGDPAADFLVRHAGYSASLSAEGLSIRGRRPGVGPRGDFEIRLLDANRGARAEGLDPTGGHSNYFIGNDPSRWSSGVPHFRRVRYQDAYSGIDVVYHARGNDLEYDFVIAPGADPEVIQLGYEGVRSLRLDDQGDLIIDAGAGPVRQPRPTIYQESGARRLEVQGRYRLEGGRQVGFELEAYNPALALVIDPVVNTYSTYLGGSGEEQTYSIAADADGNAYVVGRTFSTDFPTSPEAAQTNNHGRRNAFLTQLTPDGSGIRSSTYWGGSGDDAAKSIAVDENGIAYITGFAFSPDFPTTDGSTPLSGLDYFMLIYDPAADRILYSTITAGTGNESGQGIAVSPPLPGSDGNSRWVAVTGQVESRDFPVTADGDQPRHGGGDTDAFRDHLLLVQDPATGDVRVAARSTSYLGGSGDDEGMDVGFSAATGPGGEVVYSATFGVTTNSPNLRVSQGAVQRQIAGGYDLYFARFTMEDSLHSSRFGMAGGTCLGGSNDDLLQGLDIDPSGGIVSFAAMVDPLNFPASPGVAQPNSLRGAIAVGELSGDLRTRIWSTFIGGRGLDRASGIQRDVRGCVIVSGWTDSDPFTPIVHATQPRFGGGTDATVTILCRNGRQALFSTYIGGAGDDSTAGVAVTPDGSRFYVVGRTDRDWPTSPNAFQTQYRGGRFDA
ncbi:MAG: hypothetical protein GY953_37745, partial [bacterium]|nr:hypothetical protein [bacterium]